MMKKFGILICGVLSLTLLLIIAATVEAEGGAERGGIDSEKEQISTGGNNREDLSADSPKPESGSPEEPLLAKVVELIEQKNASAQQHLDRVESLLKEGKPLEVNAAVTAAREASQEVQRGLCWIRELAPRWKEEAKYFSVIKVRIVRTRTQGEEVSRHASPGAQRYARLLGKIFYKILGQVITAKILEAAIIGNEYARGTLKAKIWPLQKRRDLIAGGALEMRVVPANTGLWRLEEEQKYWLVITPPLPRGGGTEVVLAISAGK